MSIINSRLFVVVAITILTATCANKPSARRTVQPAMAAVVPITRTLTPLPVRPLSPKLEASRKRAEAAAAATRELPWQSRPGMTELTGWEYGTRTSELAQVLGGDDLRLLGKLASAAGILPEGIDLATLAAGFTALSAGAAYSPFHKQVLLLANRDSNESQLVHEFVHALQDQHFDLQHLLLGTRPYNFDRTEAIFAVVEGDAMSAQRRLENPQAFARRSLEEITRGENERFNLYRDEVGGLFPPLLTETFIFRYRDGLRFVETVRRSPRGQPGVNDLFRRPPQSSEQVLHPEKYLTNEAPRSIQINEARLGAEGWSKTSSTPLGEIGIRGLLTAGITDKDAARAAAGWGGDCAYLFERPNAVPLFVWRTEWDRAEDALEFFRAYNRLHNRRYQPEVGAATASNELQAQWNEAGRTTLVRRVGDAVIIVRGAEADAQKAFTLL